MPISIHHLDERSEEVQELITRIPGWMIRWGTLVVSTLLVGIITGSWLIRYPDVVSGTFKLSSSNIPKGIYTRTDGKLARLFIHDGVRVHNGQALACVESTADYKQVLSLDTALHEMYSNISRSGIESITLPDWNRYGQLGELQADVQTFGQSLIELNSYRQGNYYGQKKLILQKEIADLHSLAGNLKQQQQFQDRDSQLAREEYAMHQKLAAQRVIAPNELKQAESRELSRMLPSEQSKAALIQNNSLQEEKKKELLDLDNQAFQYRALFIQRLNTLRSAIEEWKSKYIITAPIDGTVYFSTVIQENQYLSSHQRVFDIAPPGNGYLGELFLSQQNLGKVKLNQQVMIKFAGYPFEQYGYVPGKITSIADVPFNDSVFLVRVSLPQGLLTVYHQQIIYKSGLLASGEVITADARLLQRLFYNIRKAVASR